MVSLQSFFNIASISVGFIAAICFCIGAATNKTKDIALSSATIAGGNPTHMRSLSAQKAQYIIGAILLTVSFGIQAAAALTPNEAQIQLPFFFQSSLVQLLSMLVFVSVVAFVAISRITKGTETAARQYLKNLIEKQSVK